MMRAMLWARGSLALGAVALTIVGARTQNLDEGKSGAKLYADSCAACHRNARGLAKGRFRLMLYLFLQQHYASNSGAAWELASYLESIDDAARSRSRAGVPRHAPPHASKSGSPRPPAPVPQR